MATELEKLKVKEDERNKKGEINAKEDAILDELTMKIERILKHYDDVSWAQARVERFRSPSKDFMSGFIRHCGSEYPILPDDLGADGLKPFRVDTLAATAAREKSWIHRFIDKHEFLKKFFAIKSAPNHPSVFIYSESSIRRVERIVMNISFCLLLLCPIIALSVVQNTVGKLAVVLGFLLAGAFLMSGVLTGANNTGLAVLAGYGAILIFFLGVKLDLS